MVADESGRIISLGLAPKDDLHLLVEKTLDDIAVNNESKAFDILASLHEDLSAIKISGDFEKIRPPVVDKNDDLTVSPDIDHKATTINNIINIQEDVEIINKICSNLHDIAYKLGSKGEHEAAYMVERSIISIESSLIGRTE